MLSVVVDLEGKFLILILEHVTLAEPPPIALFYKLCKIVLCKYFCSFLSELINFLFLNRSQFQPQVSILEYLHPWDSLFTCFRILSRFFLVFSTIRFIQQGHGQMEIAGQKG